MKRSDQNNILGILCVIAGLIVVAFSLGDLLIRVCVALVGLSLVNYGLNLRGLPPLQVLIPLIMSRKRFF